MKKYPILLLLLLTLQIQAQISTPSLPNFSKSQQKIHTIKTPPLDHQKLTAEDTQAAANHLPPRFGKIFKVAHNLQNSGKWTTLPNGDRIWRLQIHCPEARSINLTYSDFHLPKGATFHLYNPSRTKILGAFTAFNNHPSRTFATNVIEDERTILEYYEPAAVKGQGVIQISRIVHGYRFIRSIEAEIEEENNLEKGFNDSGACNVNINCPEGDDWQDQKKAVARIIMINSLCSGALVNNQTQDCTPYFLTANHCTDGFSSAQMNQFIFQFNYESPNCSNINGPTNQSVTGASLKANLAASDFALLELNSEPPPEYNVYYAGWTNTPAAATSVTGIHHPAGDIKKICIENQPVTTSGNEWRVDDWDVGVTEGGSSGSPIFNPSKHIVGQLFGGSAACAGTNDNGAPDFYGKFSHSWDAGGSANNQLKTWLDPNNTGIIALDGRYCDDPYCESTGNSTANHITNVTVNTTSNNSGSDGGYGDYKNVTVTVTEGQNNSISLTPNNNNPKYWRVWIDFNGDEDLDDTGEMVFQSNAAVTGTISGTLDLPDCINNIETRLRVSMSSTQFPNPCQVGFSGEVEDYTVNLQSSEADNYDFTATPTAGLAPVTVQYTTLYTGTGGNSADDFTWSWNFSGGTPATSNLQNPTVTYSTGGNFNVSVDVTNTQGCTYTISKQNYITISDYCSTTGTITTDEWIGRVAIADIDNSTGADGGYGNYTNISTDLFLGDTYTIELEPEFAGDLYNEFWRVWIDYNRDGDFDKANELVFDAGAATNAAVSGEITIPTTAQQGTTRMRVSMKYNDDSGAPTPCETFTWGEVEDYTVNLTTPNACNLPNSLTFTNLNYLYYTVNWANSADAQSYTLRYRPQGTATWTTIPDLTSNSYLATLQQPCSTYEWQIKAVCDVSESEFSNSYFTTTLGCNDSYCYGYENGVDTWISSTTFNGQLNNSGQNYGYGNYTNLIYGVSQNQNYNVSLSPQSNGGTQTVYWKIWIDFNQDQVFDPFNELAFSTSNSSNSQVIGTVNIPSNAAIGTTRMRISLSTNSNASPCSTYTGEGEVEDYSLQINAETVNNPPTAFTDQFTTNEDESLLMNVLANDQDADGNFLTIDNFTPTSNGTLTLQENGELQYVPNENFNGMDEFMYQANDGNGGLSAATLVQIEVLPINDFPIALNDNRTTNEDTDLQIEVLNNDSDVDGDALQIEEFGQPSNGTLQQIGETLEYSPDLNFFGEDQFSYTISDGASIASATVTIDVLPINDAPTAMDDLITTDRNTAVNVTILQNDSDVDGDNLNIEAFAQAANGTVTQNGQQLTYTPDNNFIGTDEFDYTIADGNGETATATVRINVIDVNSAPQALADEIETDEDTPIGFNVLANDSDPDNDALSINTFTQPENGTIEQVGEDFLYTPNADFFGNDLFTYQLVDETGTVSNFAEVDIRVWSVNDAPIAVDDSKTVIEDKQGIVSVLNNDIDVDDSFIAIESFSQGANGSVEIIGTSVLRYTPTADFNGMDSYTYRIRDAKNAISNEATVFITVLPTNDLPTIANDQITTNEDTPVAFDVRSNDIDLDGDVLEIVEYSETANGTLTQEPDGSFTYSPTTNFNGSDQFTYRITDGSGEVSDLATVNIEVLPINDAPNIENDIVETDEDVAVTIRVLENDSDLDGDVLKLASFTPSSNGTLTETANDNELLYTPNENFNGQDEFFYTASDDKGGENTAKVTIIVFAVNDLPLAIDDMVSTLENTPVGIEVLNNDSDVDGDGLSIITFKQADNGTVTQEGNELIYSPNQNFNGNDQFTYTVSDNNGGTANATVFVTVTGVNQAPSAIADSFTTLEDTSADLDVLQNDSDPDGDNLTIAYFNEPLNGTLELLANNQLKYTPNENFFGLDEFFYHISDIHGSTSDFIDVIIVVSPVNDEPLVIEDEFVTDEDVVVNLDVLQNDKDVDGDVLTINDFTQTSNGTLALLPNNQLQYTPRANYFGIDSFMYQVSDGNGSVSEMVEVVIEVWPVNDLPIAVNDLVVLNEDSSVSIAVLENDSDVETNTADLVIENYTETVNGTLEKVGNELLYTPNTNYFGADEFTYEIRDNAHRLSNIATVFIEVQAVPDPPTVPVLLTPEHESEVSMEVAPLTFTWEASTDPDNETLEYTLILLKDSDGSEVVSTTTTYTFYELDINLLQPETLYKWIVTTSDGLFTAASTNFNFSTSEIVDIEVVDRESGTILGQNLPNPFASQTVIPFYLASANQVSLEVFDLTGKRVAVLLEGEELKEGWHEVEFEVDGLASGVYWYRLRTEDVVLGKRMVLTR